MIPLLTMTGVTLFLCGAWLATVGHYTARDLPESVGYIGLFLGMIVLTVCALWAGWSWAV